jgi:hypothetical protein
MLWAYACLFITCLWSCFTSFIVYRYLSLRIGHGFVHVQFYLDKDRFFVMLMSSVRLCFVLHFEAPEWFLVCWQIASYSYMSSHMATVWYHPASSKLWNLTTCLLLIFRKNWLARLGIFSRVNLACSACCVLDVGCRFCVNTWSVTTKWKTY